MRASYIQTIILVDWSSPNMGAHAIQIPGYFSASTKRIQLKRNLFYFPGSKLCNRGNSIKMRSVAFTRYECKHTNEQTEKFQKFVFGLRSLWVVLGWLFYSFLFNVEPQSFYSFIIHICINLRGNVSRNSLLWNSY